MVRSYPACLPPPRGSAVPRLYLCLSLLPHLLVLCLLCPTQAQSSSSSTAAAFFSSSGVLPSNATNFTVPACSAPHPLFAEPLNILFNFTFPTTSSLQPFPDGSFLHHCPNLNASQSSCCDDESVQFAQIVVDSYVDLRTRLSDGLTQLTIADLYSVLTGAAGTNTTDGTNSTAGLHLSADQLSVLTSVMEVVQLWGAGALNCSDHWMSYLTSTFCLACDPLPSYWLQFDPYGTPFFPLQQSACTAIFQHCSHLFVDFFELLPPLLAQLQLWPASTPAWYNVSAEWWSSYSDKLSYIAEKASLEINIDLCSNGGDKPDCSHLFCDGSSDRLDQWYPHAFRGLQYGADSRSLHFVLDAHAYIASMVCTLRVAYNASSGYDETNYGGRSDGCTANTNLLNLLLPRQFGLSPVLSSSCVPGFYHQPNENDVHSCTAPRWCWWDPPAQHTTHAPLYGADGLDGSLGPVAGAPQPVAYASSVYDELCDTRGFAYPLWLNTTRLDEAWPAYQVGCQLNLSRHICQLPPLPTPPRGVEEVVDALFHRLFVVVVAVGLSVLLCALGWLCRRYRVERVERLEARVADERSGSAMELEWEEALMAGKRMRAGGADVGVDAAEAAGFESPRSARSGRMWSDR